MCEKIKWWMLFISLCIGIVGGLCLTQFYRLNNEITNLSRQIEQKDMLINYLEEEVHYDN